jgi:hypothetical protein
MLEVQRRTAGQLYDQLQFPADSLNVASQRREIHVGLFFDLRHRRLLNIQRLGDLKLGFSGDLPKLPRAFSFLLEFQWPGPLSGPGFRAFEPDGHTTPKVDLLSGPGPICPDIVNNFPANSD